MRKIAREALHLATRGGDFTYAAGHSYEFTAEKLSISERLPPQLSASTSFLT